MILFLLLPLSNILIAGFLGRYLGIKFVQLTCISNLTCLLFLLFYYFYTILLFKYTHRLNLGILLNIESIVIDYSFSLDFTSISMLLPVIIISLIVNIFAIDYMKHDPDNQRFFAYLNLFSLFMIVLVMADNFLILFIGWEFIGVSSFVLIGFWFKNIDNVKSSLNALFINKIGDLSFLISILMLLFYYQSLNFDSIFSLATYIHTDINWIIILMLLISACCKSAQYGLHSWLIWAMAGPTPVSVLLHAATLVIAGAYILIRSSFLIEFSPSILIFILWLGAITSLVSGFIAVFNNDLKKIIALSTMSQLGILFVSLGLSNYNLTLFHIICHSFYKALLFISAGNIIHSLSNEFQDIRKLGGLAPYFPITYISILIASLALMGFPALTGFYSKDIIIESNIGVYSISGFLVYWIVVFSSLLTNIYSLKLIFYSFFNTTHLSKYILNKIIEFNRSTNIFIIISMIILTTASIFVGYLLHDIYGGLGSHLTGIFIHPQNISIIDTHMSIDPIYKLIPIINIFLGIIFTILIYEFKYTWLFIYNNNILIHIYKFFNSRLYFDLILNNIIIRKTLLGSKWMNSTFEQGVLSLIGPVGLKYWFNSVSFYLLKFSTNLFYNNILYIVYSIFFLILINFTF